MEHEQKGQPARSDGYWIERVLGKEKVPKNVLERLLLLAYLEEADGVYFVTPKGIELYMGYG